MLLLLTQSPPNKACLPACSGYHNSIHTGDFCLLSILLLLFLLSSPRNHDVLAFEDAGSSCTCVILSLSVLLTGGKTLFFFSDVEGRRLLCPWRSPEPGTSKTGRCFHLSVPLWQQTRLLRFFHTAGGLQCFCHQQQTQNGPEKWNSAAWSNATQAKGTQRLPRETWVLVRSKWTSFPQCWFTVHHLEDENRKGS